MLGGKKVSTPLPSYVKLCLDDFLESKAKKASMAKVPYLSTVVGSLMYAMIYTRSDNIAYVMGVLNRYMSNPDKKHWEAIKGVMQYLKGTRACVEGYIDAFLQEM